MLLEVQRVFRFLNPISRLMTMCFAYNNGTPIPQVVGRLAVRLHMMHGNA